MEFLEQIDQQLFLFLNGFNSPFWDTVMYWISYKFTWVPLYLATLIYFIYKQRTKAILTIVMTVVVIAFADQISVNLFKNVFLRYRPCHNLDIQNMIHLVNNKCGGQYGFVSSHAANAFGFAIFAALIIRNKYTTAALIVWALVVSYSRIYLGVHYPADILGGAILGTGLAFILHPVYKELQKVCPC